VESPLSWKITAGFVAAVVVIAAIVIGLDHFQVGQPPPSADATQAAQITIYSFDDQRVTQLDLTASDKTASVKRDPETKEWVLADTGEPANTSSLTSLLFRMSSLKANSRVAGTGADLTQFGLSPPKDQITATLDDGSKYTLLLGSNTPIGTGTYAKTDSADDVYIITTQFGSDLERLAGDPRQPPTPTPRPATPVPTAPAADATPGDTPVPQ
jgi:hypothetical protein